MEVEEKIALRRKCNFILESVVSLSFLLNPELRYIQNLWVLDLIDQKDYREGIEIVDRFSEEPYDTIVRILPKIKELLNKRFSTNPTITNKLIRSNILNGLEKIGLTVN